MAKKPWDINPDLNKERIAIVGNFLADVRGEVIDLHDEKLGDTALSLGMRAYECCRSRLITKDKSGDWPWFSILTSDGRFTFLIGSVPVRFVRNDPKHLPSKKLITSEEFEAHISMFPDDEFSKIRWFFVIDTYYKNAADDMYFVGYNKHGDIISSCEVQIQSSSVVLASVPETQADAVAIRPAPIKVRKLSDKSIEINE